MSVSRRIAGTTLLLGSLFSSASEPVQAQQQGQRQFNANVSYNFAPGYRTITLDCATVKPAVRANGTMGLTPSVAWAAQFDWLPDLAALRQLNAMQPAARAQFLAKQTPEAKHNFETMLRMPLNVQESFYIRRGMTQNWTDGNPSNKAIYDETVNHVVYAHGVKLPEIGQVMQLCRPYHGLR